MLKILIFHLEEFKFLTLLMKIYRFLREENELIIKKSILFFLIKFWEELYYGLKQKYSLHRYKNEY